MSFIDLLLWPINTVIALMGIALASLELQERKIIRGNAVANPQTLELDDFEVEVSTDIQMERLNELIRAELENRQHRRVTLPQWATRRQRSYFVPLRSRGYVHESRPGIWVPWGILSFRYGPLIIVLVLAILQSISESRGGTYPISYLAFAGFLLSVLWAAAMFAGIYIEEESAKPHLICGPFRVSEVSLKAVEIIEKSEGRFGVLACVDTLRYSGFQLRFLHDNCDLHDAVAQTVSSLALLRSARSGSRLKVRVSRDFTDPLNDRIDGFVDKVRWGLLAFYNLVAQWMKPDA